MIRSLDLFRQAIHLITLLPANDPDLVAVAKVLRDAVPAVNDMVQNGEGHIELRFDEEGRLIYEAHTANHTRIERVV